MGNDIPCFNPEDVMFIINKWDVLHINDFDTDDSSDEEEGNKVWENIKSNIKRIWPALREENIFKMNLKDVILVFFTNLNVDRNVVNRHNINLSISLIISLVKKKLINFF